MRVLSLPYEIVLGRSALLPACDIHLLGPHGRALVKVVVDSGAEYPVFPASAAEDAGLPLPVAPNVFIQYGAGRSPGRLLRAYIELRGRRWDTEIVFVERLDFRYGLLGRRGVFARFNEVAFLEKVSTPRIELRW